MVEEDILRRLVHVRKRERRKEEKERAEIERDPEGLA